MLIVYTSARPGEFTVPPKSHRPTSAISSSRTRAEQGSFARCTGNCLPSENRRIMSGGARGTGEGSAGARDCEAKDTWGCPFVMDGSDIMNLLNRWNQRTSIAIQRVIDQGLCLQHIVEIDVGARNHRMA